MDVEDSGVSKNDGGVASGSVVKRIPVLTVDELLLTEVVISQRRTDLRHSFP